MTQKQSETKDSKTNEQNEDSEMRNQNPMESEIECRQLVFLWNNVQNILEGGCHGYWANTLDCVVAMTVVVVVAKEMGGC